MIGLDPPLRGLRTSDDPILMRLIELENLIRDNFEEIPVVFASTKLLRFVTLRRYTSCTSRIIMGSNVSRS